MTAGRVFFLVCFLGLQASVNSLGQSIECDSVYTIADEAPMFRNGYDDFAFYISKLDYGDCALNGAVILTWIIDRSGRMIDIDVPGFKGECKDRVIKQLEQFPTWSPARVMGMPVCFRMKLRKGG